MGEYIPNSHHVTVLLYQLVSPAKYRRAVFDKQVDEALKETCWGIEQRYQVKFLEIDTEEDHVHFLIQSVPTDRITKVVTLVKRLTAQEIFRRCLEVKKHFEAVRERDPNSWTVAMMQKICVELRSPLVPKIPVAVTKWGNALAHQRKLGAAAEH